MSSAVPLFTGEVTQEQADQVLLLIENLINNAKWKSEGLVQGIEMVSAPYPQSPLKMYRAICVVPNTNSKNLANEIWMMNTPKKINMYDKSVSKFKTVETINENIRVDFVEAAMPWPVWNRDLVYAIARKNSADVIYMWAYSIIRPNVPSAEKTVRMKIVGYFKFQDKNNQCHVTRFCFGDPEGNIPNVIINNQAKTQVVGILKYLLEVNSKPKAKL